MNKNSAEETALTRQGLARALQVSMGTISRWNRENCPRFYLGTPHGKGSRPRYYLEQVKAWLEARTAADKGKETAPQGDIFAQSRAAVARLEAKLAAKNGKELKK